MTHVTQNSPEGAAYPNTGIYPCGSPVLAKPPTRWLQEDNRSVNGNVKTVTIVNAKINIEKKLHSDDF